MDLLHEVKQRRMEQEARNAERREQYEALRAEERRKFMEQLEKRHEKFHSILGRPRDVLGCKLPIQADIQAGSVEGQSKFNYESAAKTRLVLVKAYRG